MNKTLSTILIVFAVLALAGGIFFFGTMYARLNGFGSGMPFGYSWNNNNSYGPGMTLAPGAFPGVGSGRGNYSPGMMGTARGNFGVGPGMMGAYGWNNGTGSNVAPLTVDQAKQSAQKYLQSLNIQGLEIGEVMVFDNNAYVSVMESGTGLGAFELLVDPVSQVAYPEYGPNMMWNLKYGGLSHGSMTLAPGASAGVGSYGGMMGGWNNGSTTPATVSADMPVTKDQAIKNAQAYLDQDQSGAVAADDPTQFYGYYTLDFSKDGKVVGMLSVNGYNGQIFLHTWHGTFIEEAR
jgi:hypothetical protein